MTRAQGRGRRDAALHEDSEHADSEPSSLDEAAALQDEEEVDEEEQEFVYSIPPEFFDPDDDDEEDADFDVAHEDSDDDELGWEDAEEDFEVGDVILEDEDEEEEGSDEDGGGNGNVPRFLRTIPYSMLARLLQVRQRSTRQEYPELVATPRPYLTGDLLRELMHHTSPVHFGARAVPSLEHRRLRETLARHNRSAQECADEARRGRRRGRVSAETTASRDADDHADDSSSGAAPLPPCGSARAARLRRRKAASSSSGAAAVSHSTECACSDVPAPPAAATSRAAARDAGAASSSEAHAGSSEAADLLMPPKPNLQHMLLTRENAAEVDGGWSSGAKRHVMSMLYPPCHAVKEVESRHGARCYIGQYSHDGSMFLAAYQDAHVRVFDVDRGFKLRKDVEARRIHWTITDTAISPDSRFLLYSTISQFVHLVDLGTSRDIVRSVANITEVHHELNFQESQSTDSRSLYMDRCGIWSLAWSANSQEVVAGTTTPGIVLYDLQAETVKATARCHRDDVNAVAFLDPSGNTVLSGSDDSHILLHDRRTMGSGNSKPEGLLQGHTEGVTHLHARGDGRYLISNAKDSTIRIWDVRKMTTDAYEIASAAYGSLSDFDYRWQDYPYAQYDVRRAKDSSVMTFRGHAVLQTLIRAYWAPEAQAGGRCLYSGSADGCVYLFDTITGEVTHKLVHHDAPVRDCSWHPTRPELTSVSWDGAVVQWGPRPEASGVMYRDSPVRQPTGACKRMGRRSALR